MLYGTVCPASGSAEGGSLDGLCNKVTVRRFPVTQSDAISNDLLNQFSEDPETNAEVIFFQTVLKMTASIGK